MKRGPQAIGNVLSELMSRRGFARVQSAGAYDAAWRDAAGPLVAAYTRVGQLRRGTLEVVVANSTLIQELGFQKQALLKVLANLLPDQGIENLRFRVGNIE
jgi:predicted nucleic acid-binding Zn ribbon protein